mgnify:CR=1 FL=1
MYIETSNGSPGDKAELASYRYFASSPNCRMSLWYHMFGTGVGSLEVKLKKSDGTYEILGNALSGSQVSKYETQFRGRRHVFSGCLVCSSDPKNFVDWRLQLLAPVIQWLDCAI